MSTPSSHIECPLILDFEASSLRVPDSYPIEVAWCDTHGAIESHLISPAGVMDWIDWDNYAESTIHHIDRPMLLALGRPHSWVASRMNACLLSNIVYSDNPEFDEHWMRRLFAAADIKPTFRLAHVDVALMRLDANSTIGATNRIRRAYLDAKQSSPLRHRAEADVAYLLDVWNRARASMEGAPPS